MPSRVERIPRWRRTNVPFVTSFASREYCQLSLTGSGGAVASGAAGLTAIVVISTIGGALAGGTAGESSNPKASIAGSGGALIGGAATVAVVPPIAGGAFVGGAAAVAATYTVAGSGGVVIAGTASYTGPGELLDHVATGGILTSGSGSFATSSPRTAYAFGHRYLTFRYELYDLNGEFVEVLDNVLSGQITMAWLAPIKRRASFVLRESDIDINWLTDRIKPWCRLHLPPYGENDWVEWPMGVFLLSSPTRTTDSSGAVLRKVDGYDLLQVLNDDLVDDRYTISAGATHTSEVLTLLGDLPYKLTTHTSTTRTTREWEPGTSKLKIINELLGSISYKSLAFDEDGIALIEPYVSPANRTEEWTYADDETSLIGEDVEQECDLFSVANKWVLVVSNPDADPLVATYTNDNPASPTSTVRRGRTIVDFREQEDADTQSDLDAKAARLAFNASQIYEHLRFTTGINPLHSCNDVYRITFTNLAINSSFVETKWEMDLVSGSQMKHEARRVVAI